MKNETALKTGQRDFERGMPEAEDRCLVHSRGTAM